MLPYLHSYHTPRPEMGQVIQVETWLEGRNIQMLWTSSLKFELEMSEGMDILLSGEEGGDEKRMRCVENYDVWVVFVLILNDRL